VTFLGSAVTHADDVKVTTSKQNPMQPDADHSSSDCRSQAVELEPGSLYPVTA